MSTFVFSSFLFSSFLFIPLKYYIKLFTLTITPTKKRCCIATDPKILGKKKDFFFFFLPLFRKKCIKTFKTEKYQPKEGVKKKRKEISNRLTHVLALKGQYDIFFFKANRKNLPIHFQCWSFKAK